VQLRDYQEAAIAEGRAHYARGARSLLFVGPTGMGKTILGVSLALSHVSKGGRVLWLAHRQELVQQAADSVRQAGEVPGIIAPWASPFPHARIQVASVQTLVARDQRPEASVVVLDEAHHHVAEQWGTVADSYRDALRIGLTATPERQDGVGLGNLFDALIPVAQPATLIANGHLVPVEVLRPAAASKSLAEDPVEAWRRWGKGGKAIVFASSVKAAKDIASRFEALGVPARAITGKLGSADREVAIVRFRSGTVRVLCGVHTLTEGLDVPDASVAILARGFSSPGAYIQAVGRVMRPAPGKTCALILDLMGVSIDHGLPDEDRSYSLQGKAIKSKEGLLPIRQCPACGRVFRAAEFHGVKAIETSPGSLMFEHVPSPRPRCPGCGYEMPLRHDPRVRRQAMVAAHAGHTSDRRISALQQLFATARAKGYKPGWAVMQFKVRYGQFPSQDMKIQAGWR